MLLLKNQVAIITGAGRGWGQSIAAAYARQGASVIVVSRTQSEIDLTVEMIENENGHVEGFSIDVSVDSQVEKLFNYVSEKYGHIDILINNAAIMPLKKFEDLSLDEIDRILSVNLRAPVAACKFALDIMKKQKDGGSIINVSSTSGIRGFVNESVYCACKHGIEGFSKAIAEEFAPHNIAVNTITPSGSASKMRIKPTSITQAEFDRLPEEEKSKWSDPIVSTEAFVFLGLQRANGVSGQRILAYELSEHIRKDGWDIVMADLREDELARGKY